MRKKRSTRRKNGAAAVDPLYASDLQGEYHPFRFTVRLRREFIDHITEGLPEIVPQAETDPNRAEGWAVFLHETMHWWQHIGSTTGLMMSLAHPAQTHINHVFLRQLTEQIGPWKSLRSHLGLRGDSLPASAVKLLNSILNNWHDLEFNRRLILNPQTAMSAIRSPFFESVGHSMHIGLRYPISMLSTAVDRAYKFLPDARNWPRAFDALRDMGVEGFYHGSPARLPCLGAFHIFEGQAKMTQLQRLHYSSRGSLNWSDFKKMGMLGEEYITAFGYFLEWSKLDWPDSPVDPVVFMFLLACDLAINPGEGFPFDIENFERFKLDIDPGFRFMLLSGEIGRDPSLVESVQIGNRSEYIEASETLCERLSWHSPSEIFARIAGWAEREPSLQALLAEEDKFEFKPIDLPVRLLFSKALRLAADRIRNPEFFCWTAAQTIGLPGRSTTLERTNDLIHRHWPMFMSELDGAVLPVLFKGKEQKQIESTCSDFFSWNAMYDMVRQWIVSDGPFEYDFGWITKKRSPEVVKEWVGAQFKNDFGVAPDSFQCW